MKVQEFELPELRTYSADNILQSQRIFGSLLWIATHTLRHRTNGRQNLLTLRLIEDAGHSRINSESGLGEHFQQRHAGEPPQVGPIKQPPVRIPEIANRQLGL